VLSHDETAEAIKTGKGWFNRQGRWVNKAGWEKQHAHLSDWVIAKLAN
jgi:stalled ribosome alternative rescue factor ArfA